MDCVRIFEYDQDFATTFQFDEEDQVQPEDNEDLSSQEDTIDFFVVNNGGFLDLFNELKEEVTREDIIATDSEEIASVAEGVPGKKTVENNDAYLINHETKSGSTK